MIEKNPLIITKSEKNISLDSQIYDKLYFPESFNYLYSGRYYNRKHRMKIAYRIVKFTENLVSNDIHAAYFNDLKTVFERNISLFRYLRTKHKFKTLIDAGIKKRKTHDIFATRAGLNYISGKNTPFRILDLSINKRKHFCKIRNLSRYLRPFNKMVFYSLFTSFSKFSFKIPYLITYNNFWRKRYFSLRYFGFKVLLKNFRTKSFGKSFLKKLLRGSSLFNLKEKKQIMFRIRKNRTFAHKHTFIRKKFIYRTRKQQKLRNLLKLRLFKRNLRLKKYFKKIKKICRKHKQITKSNKRKIIRVWISTLLKKRKIFKTPFRKKPFVKLKKLPLIIKFNKNLIIFKKINKIKKRKFIKDSKKKKKNLMKHFFIKKQNNNKIVKIRKLFWRKRVFKSKKTKYNNLLNRKKVYYYRFNPMARFTAFLTVLNIK